MTAIRRVVTDAAVDAQLSLAFHATTTVRQYANALRYAVMATLKLVKIVTMETNDLWTDAVSDVELNEDTRVMPPVCHVHYHAARIFVETGHTCLLLRNKRSTVA